MFHKSAGPCVTFAFIFTVLFPVALCNLIGNSPCPRLNSNNTSTEHIVILASADADLNAVLQKVKLDPSHPNVNYLFNNSVFAGFVANLPDEHARALHAMPAVSTLEQTARLRSSRFLSYRQPSSVSSPAAYRPDSPWGLQRISSAAIVRGDPKKLAYTFSFNTQSPLGAGVDVYIVDSGINTENEAFRGRAHSGFSFDPQNASDSDGHGTHVAGTSAGSPFGIATSANVIAVKVLGPDGSGTSSSILAGIDYIIRRHDESKGKSGFVGSVINMSLGLGISSSAVNSAVLAAASAGIHIAAAAGNDASDACSSSPGQLGGPKTTVVTVGSIGQDDSVSTFSNTGACVDVYAPGEHIVSAWKDGTKVMNLLSGTSMASPHIAGVMAVMMSETPSLAKSPAALKAKLLSNAALLGMATSGSPILLLNDGVRDGTGSQGILGLASRGSKDQVQGESLGGWSMSEDSSDIRW